MSATIFTAMARTAQKWRKVAKDHALTQDFGKNENENHADEESGLLGSSSHTSVTDDANGETGSKTSETDRQTGTELNEAGVEGSLLLKIVGDQHRHDQAVNGNDTSHDDGDNVCKGMC